MREKKILFVVLAAMMMVTVFASVAQAISQFPQIEVTIINQEPDPVSPGNTVDVRFRIENLGSNPAQDMQVKLVLNYPFSLYGQEQEIKNIGTVAGYQTDEIGVREKWKLFVDTNAATGSGTIEFWYKMAASEWTKAGEYPLAIQSREAVLAINQIKVDQDSIMPGTRTQVAFVLENMADNSLRDIKLTLGILTEVSTASSVTYRELPFTPMGSGNEKTLKNLATGESKDITFDIFTDADATSKVYKVPYALTYSDTSGSNFTMTGIVGLLVDSNPELGINMETTDIYSAGAKGTVQIKLVNKGFSDIKFLDIKLGESENYQILSNPEVYIGKLDSDDYDTADYSLMVSSKAKDSVILPLYIEYRDANGHLFKKDVPIELKLYTGSELKQRTNGKSSSSWMIFVLIALAVIGFFVFRKLRKNKKK
ncbi:MAG: COG1361 S-layer family protein [archaeon]